jgi:hypothetical protein
MITREELMKLPEKTVIFSHGYGASVEKGVFSCWEDASIERDIFNVDAYELMKALQVETLDDLFNVIKERFSFDSLGRFLDDNGIGYGCYAH